MKHNLNTYPLCMYLSRNASLQLLGLYPNCTYALNEIKKAFKKKALIFHPDRNHGKCDDFVQIKMAYEVLTSHVKDPDYDVILQEILRTMSKFVFDTILKSQKNYTTKCDDNNDINNDTNNDTNNDNDNDDNNDDNNDIFYDTNNDICHDITIDLNISLHELYTEDGKKITIKYKDETGNMCNHIVFLSFRNYSLTNTFYGKGDWDSFNHRFSDLFINITVTKTQSYIINTCIDKHDLIKTVPISISDYYLGVCTTFVHFDENIDIRLTPSQEINCSHVIPNKGLKGKYRRGDLYIHFDVDLNHYDERLLQKSDIINIFPSLL